MVCENLKEKLASYNGKGFEFHFFKVGWYNKLVSKSFWLPYNENALSIIIISQPCMFEKTFIPFLLKIWKQSMLNSKQKSSEALQSIRDLLCESEIDCSDFGNKVLSTIDEFLDKLTLDPINECMQEAFREMAGTLPYDNVIRLHDFQMTPHRRPEVLVQTAGYVAGAVAMYRQEDLLSYGSDPLNVLSQMNTESAVNFVDEKSKRKLFPVCLHPDFGGWFGLRGILILPDVLCPEMEQKLCR